MTYVGLSNDPWQRFGCFLVHAHAFREDSGERQVRLVLEDAGTGIKRRFTTIDELRGFLDGWAEPEQDRPSTDL